MLARSFDATTGETMLVVDLSGETPTDWSDLRIVWRRPSLPGVLLAHPVEPMSLPGPEASEDRWYRVVADHRVRVEVRTAPPASE